MRLYIRKRKRENNKPEDETSSDKLQRPFNPIVIIIVFGVASAIHVKIKYRKLAL